jgi:succinyl-CoA synthetase beta subunit
MRCDLVAGGLIAAAEEASCRLPVVVRMAGARQEEGRRLLEASGLDVEWVDGLAAAAARIVRRLS